MSRPQELGLVTRFALPEKPGRVRVQVGVIWEVEMLIRVSVEDWETSERLVQDLAGLFGGTCISLHAQSEIQVQPRRESNRALVDVLDAVERWLGEADVASATVWVDEQPYILEQPGRRARRHLQEIARNR